MHFNTFSPAKVLLWFCSSRAVSETCIRFRRLNIDRVLPTRFARSDGKAGERKRKTRCEKRKEKKNSFYTRSRVFDFRENIKQINNYHLRTPVRRGDGFYVHRGINNSRAQRATGKNVSRRQRLKKVHADWKQYYFAARPWRADSRRKLYPPSVSLREFSSTSYILGCTSRRNISPRPESFYTPSILLIQLQP